MTILLSDLIALFDDDGSMQSVDALLGKVTAAERAIVEARESIDAIDRELRALGISTEEDECEADEGEDSASPAGTAGTDSEDTGTEAAPPARRAKPRTKAAMPAEDPADPRSVVEYVNALDEVAHELGAVGTAGATGMTGARGVDITEAMQRRGFPNGKRVLRIARAHPCWNEVEGQRSRFRYAAGAVGLSMPTVTENAASSANWPVPAEDAASGQQYAGKADGAIESSTSDETNRGTEHADQVGALSA